MQKRVIEFPSQRGRLVVFHSENEDQRAVGIYGDPEGLRSLGELLIAEAALNQRQIPEENLPAHERHHTHLRPGVHIHPQSIELIIGRLDSKETARLYEFWKNDAQTHLAAPNAELCLEDCPDGYFFIASEWSGRDAGAPIVVLEKSH